MARIEILAVPPRLYRYRSLKEVPTLHREIDVLSANYLWCSNFQSLNDPMEGLYGRSSLLQIPGPADKGLRSVRDKIFDAKQSVGICSFGDGNRNDVLWAHYTSQGEGICVAYKTSVLTKRLPEETIIVRVQYAEKMPTIGPSDIKQPTLAARKILSCKKDRWSYEREWRVVSPKTGKLPFDPKAGSEPIAAIYFG